MMLKTTCEIDIVRANSSKITEVDFENLTFGNVFTDHMLVCDFKDGAWQKPLIKPLIVEQLPISMANLL